MALDRTPRMQPAFSLNVGGVRFFGGVKDAEMVAAAGVPNASDKTTSVRMDAKQSGFAVDVCRTLILRVAAICRFSQVLKSVVARVAVDVVNQAVWPTPAHVKPSKPMSKVTFCVNSHAQMTGFGVLAPENGAGFMLPTKTCGNSTLKHSRVWIVSHKFTQALRGKIGFSHEAPQLLIGQRPATIRSRSPASLF